MTNKNKVIVKILGQEYTIVSDEPREYMQKVSNYVDDKMIEIAERNKKFSTAMIAVLTALNLGDEYYKLREEYEKVHEKFGNPIKELDETKQQLAITKIESEKVDAKYNELSKEYERLKDINSRLKSEYEDTKDEASRLSYELKLKESKLEKSDKIIDDLKNKLLESEVKLVQTKKELQEFIENFDESIS